MEEENKIKQRSDFSTDSEWWTYKITHPKEFEERDVEENEEKNNDKKFPHIIVECLKCGYIIDETELSPLPDESVPYDKRLKCPSCKNTTKFKYVKNKEEKEKIIRKREEEKRKLEREKNKYIKITISKIKDDLSKLILELEGDLKSGKISPERFSALLINLTFNIYKYYRYDDKMSLFFDDFRKYAYGVAENVLSDFYQEYELDEKLDLILAEYEQVKECDIIYLNHSLDYANNAEIIANSSDIEVDIINVQGDIKKLEYQIEQQKKYNDEVKYLIEKDKERKNEIDNMQFFKELKRNA